MARGKKGLLLEHLEGISWTVFDEYPKVLKELIGKEPGIYSLYKGNKLYYVGLATNLLSRVKAHLRDRHKKKWDKFSVYLLKDDGHIKELESLLLRISKPTGNRVAGNFKGSTSIRKILAREMRQQDKDKQARALGGKAEKRRQKTKVSGKNGFVALEGVFKKAITLKGWKNDKIYKGRLRTNGTFTYKGKEFEYPGKAATSATKSKTRGWGFWHFKNEKGEWVAINTLRKRRKAK